MRALDMLRVHGFIGIGISAIWFIQHTKCWHKWESQELQCALEKRSSAAYCCHHPRSRWIRQQLKSESNILCIYDSLARVACTVCARMRVVHCVEAKLLLQQRQIVRVLIGKRR